MKTNKFVFAKAAALAALLIFSASALAARPPGAGNGGGGGGGDAGTDPPDYGDLVILYRDTNGVPMLDGNQCQQPIAYPSDTCLLDCTGIDPCIVPVEAETCAVVAEYASCTQEVDFGRMNSARAPDTVFQSQLADVVVNLATADCITLDPAGRMVTSRVTDGVVSTSAIDSPLQNMAIYKQLMLVGYLGDATSPVALPAGVLDTAARGLGVGSDKGGEVNVDMVAYLNSIMGLSDPATATILPKICIDVKAEVMGTVQLVEKCFLNYSGYGYDRTANFGALPAPAYIPAEVTDGWWFEEEGWFEYLAEINPQNLPPSPPYFQILQGPILNAVFPDGEGGSTPGFTEGNIGGFTQAADDTRAVINYMHDWPIPDADTFATPVPCEDSGIATYDVSISEESGLQVPKQLVDGTEGREFTVSVANQGSSPDAASGSVTVTAIAESGGSIDGSPWVYTFTDLVPGASESWTEFFSVDLGVRTTINWTATASAPDDVNAANNTVTATSNVRVTGSGGGGGGR